MDEINIEDFEHQHIDSRFELVLIASHRGKELNHGARPNIESNKNDKEAIIALKEISTGKVDVESLRRSIIKNSSIVVSCKNSKLEEKIGEAMQCDSLDAVYNENSAFSTHTSKKDSMQQDNKLFQDEENIEE